MQEQSNISTYIKSSELNKDYFFLLIYNFFGIVKCNYKNKWFVNLMQTLKFTTALFLVGNVKQWYLYHRPTSQWTFSTASSAASTASSAASTATSTAWTASLKFISILIESKYDKGGWGAVEIMS